jgi:DNA-binding HxlR family transcriptional regulator
MIFRYLLNILTILRGDAKSFDEIFGYGRGYFLRLEDLEFQLSEMERSGIIVSNQKEDGETVYALTNLGRSILRSYPNARLKTVDLVFNKEVRSYVKLVYPSFPR